MPTLDLHAVPHFYHSYIRRVQHLDLLPALQDHLAELQAALSNISEEEWAYAYQPGKWTVKEVVQHIIDTERIFCHRALSVARQDPNPLPGFDEEAYAAASGAIARKPESLLRELAALSAATTCLFESFGEEQLRASGMANGKPISVLAIGYIMAGHALHHTQVICERYLDCVPAQLQAYP